MEPFWQALLIGLAVAAPVGPMALLCIERTLARGQVAGLAFGLGIALADAAYAALAALGVGTLSELLLASSRPLQVIGGVLMLYFGLRVALAKPSVAIAGKDPGSNARALLTAFALTLANPPTIVFFAGVFAAMSSGGAAARPAVFALGVLTGSALWWLLLSSLVRALGRFLDQRWRRGINLVCGLVVAALALWSLWPR
ncbi:MAG: LysE family transporter [Betaproteobacteria bacterium]|nr:LysE family transporter [Betaproteobacteria bacterium]